MCNCFAYNFGKCGALTAGVCHRPCNFYKTPEQLQAERAKVAKRLDSLPEEQRESIRERYYNGGSWK